VRSFYPHSSLKRASQHVIHSQLRVVAPHLGGACALGRRHKETIALCATSSNRRHILLVKGKKTRWGYL